MKHSCSRLIAVACAGFVSTTSFGQTAPSFISETSASGPTPYHVYAVDLNNDGLADIVQSGAIPSNDPNAKNSFFTVNINLGKGIFAPPVTYKINANTWPSLAWGDFNNDGKIDIVATLPGTNQVAVYLGNGDGTFQSPITTTVDLPSGMGFPWASIVAADFDHNGKLDLVAAANDGDEYGGTWGVYLLEGDGAGHFLAPISIYQPTSGWTVQQILPGDFDTDGNADVTLLEQMQGGYSNVVTLFGAGDTTFDPVDVITLNGYTSLGAADLNNDGATDLYGIEYKNFYDASDPQFGIVPNGTQLAVFLGHYGRRFSYLLTAAPSFSTNGYNGIFVAADFNGTGQPALAGLDSTYDSSGNATYRVIYFLNAGTPNVTVAYGPSPGGASGYQVGPVVGNFNGDTKPDIAVNSASAPNLLATTIGAGVNSNMQGFYGGCDYPSSGSGIRLCSPSPTENNSSPVTFAATANSFGQLRKMELWIDGVKSNEEHWVWGQSAYLNWSDQNLSPGNHDAAVYAADIDDTLQRYDFTFTVEDK